MFFSSNKHVHKQNSASIPYNGVTCISSQAYTWSLPDVLATHVFRSVSKRFELASTTLHQPHKRPPQLFMTWTASCYLWGKEKNPRSPVSMRAVSTMCTLRVRRSVKGSNDELLGCAMNTGMHWNGKSFHILLYLYEKVCPEFEDFIQ